MSFCTICMKWTLIFLNFFVMATGLVCIGFGIYILIDMSNILEFLGNTSEMPGFLEKTVIIFTVGGAVIALVAAIGLCGACKTHRRLLCIYGVLLTMGLIVQLVAIILANVYKEKLGAEVSRGLKTSLRESYVMPTEPGKGVNAFSSTWDAVQYQLECCGVTDHQDYSSAAYWIKTDNLYTNRTHYAVPLSCCKYSNPWEYPDDFEKLEFTSGSCYPNWDSSNTWTDTGCYAEMKEQLQKASLLVVIIAAITVIIQIIALIFAWALFCGCCGTKEVLV